MVKTWSFLEAILVFFRNHTLSRAGVFCFAFSASGGFFWAFKNCFLTIFPFFHHKGGPLWFRTSKKLTTPLKMAENWKQKDFCEQNYKWIKNSDGTVCLKGWIKIRISLALGFQCDPRSPGGSPDHSTNITKTQISPKRICHPDANVIKMLISPKPKSLKFH